MSLKNIVKDNYGVAIELTVVQDNVAQDLSAYSGVFYVLEDPSGAVTTKVAAFKTDGTDGVCTYTLASGDIDSIGQWRVQIKLTTGAASISTVRLPFRVLEKTE